MATADTKRIFWMMALFVVVGAPLVAVLWETLNELLALQASTAMLFAIPAALLLAGLLLLLKRTLERRDSASS